MSNMMRALVKAKAEPGIWMEEVPVPEIGPNDVLIKLEYATPEEVAQAMAKFHKIPFVDLRHTAGTYPMPMADAKAMLDATLAATDLVFVSPVYWFSIPSPLKTYLDHWSAWLRVPGLDFKERMAGKRLWVIATSGNREKAQPMFDSYRLCAEFMGMQWQPPLWGKGGAPDAVLTDDVALAAAATLFQAA